MTKTPKIWAAHWTKNTMLMPVGIDYNREDFRKAKRDLDVYYDWKAWAPNEGPLELFFDARDYREKKKTNLPNVMSITGGYALLSERMADCLRQFDLGKTQLRELTLYEYDRTTPRPGRHYLLNVAEVKSCLVPERSKGLRKIGDRWNGSVVGVELTVLPSATEGVDLWADSQLRETLFMSDRLAKAIKGGKFGRTFLQPVEVLVPS